MGVPHLSARNDRTGARPDQPDQYFPALDGLRGIGALCVIIAHVRLENLPGAPILMDLFFVISGFLITLILLRNVECSGDIQLLRFWGRRLRRLYPVLLVVVVCALLAGWPLFHPDDWHQAVQDAAASLVYISNWTLMDDKYPGYFSHTWSLSIEEQFYVAWPLLLWLIGKTDLKRPHVIILFLVIMMATAAWRNALIADGATWSRIYYGLDTRMDAFFSGGILALAYPVLSHLQSMRGLPRMIVQSAPFGLMTAIAYWRPGEIDYFIWQQTVVLFLSVATVLAVSMTGPSWLNSLLVMRPVRRLGLMCYSLYLWHWPLIFLLRGHWDLPPVIVLPGTVLGTILLSHLTYRYVESPILSRRVQYRSCSA